MRYWDQDPQLPEDPSKTSWILLEGHVVPVQVLQAFGARIQVRFTLDDLTPTVRWVDELDLLRPPAGPAAAA